jgi:hypothetical protein
MDIGVASPRTSSGYIATFALLQTSIVAVNSDWRSGVIANPDVNRIMLFRPGMLARLCAIFRIASNRLCAPKSIIRASSMSEPLLDNPREGSPLTPGPILDVSGLELTAEVPICSTTFFSRTGSAVKFCTILMLPPNCTTAITRSGPAFWSMNFAAAARAWG